MTARAMSCCGDDALACLMCDRRTAEPFCSENCRHRYAERHTPSPDRWAHVGYWFAVLGLCLVAGTAMTTLLALALATVT